MCKKLFFLITIITLISLAGNLRAEPFSIGAVEDIELGNDPQVGPGASSNGSGLGARDITDRRRVFLVSYDISSIKGKGIISNASFSHVSHDQHGETNVYGIIESLDLLGIESLTWNTAPGCQNNPTPASNSPVELDYADLTDVLVTFTGPGSALQRFSTDTSQALADFLNNDTDGIVTFLFAPAAENQQLIVRSSEHEMGGSLLEGDVSPLVGIALDPQPDDNNPDVIRDVVLSWTPGEFAATHNVYLGTNFDDVNNADTSSPLLVGPGVNINNFNPGRLEFGQTYYWRVDEVNAAPDFTPYKGYTWTFTVEPYSITIPEDSITATASSQAEGQGPENTINSSGLDANDLHSTATADMWITPEGDSGPAWIQYEFDKPYQLLEMPVWNYNGNSILALFGIKDVVVEYSLDGTNWEQVTDVTQFTKATGAEGYAYNTVVNFNKAAAKYVRIKANSSWGGDLLGSTQIGLSEVRFEAIPVAARNPNPADEATDIAVDATLGWRAGRDADEHNVYISTDQQAVTDGTVSPTTVNQNIYSPSSLDLGSTYYWRVDEVNNAEATPLWEGAVWSFSTQEYLVVEDFESYNDIPEGEAGSNLVYLTWIDGYENPSTNGSTMGYITGSSVETENVYGGNQSVPMFYVNSTAGVSKVTVDPAKLPIGRNWAKGSPEKLVIWIYGGVGNNTATDQLYATINSKKVPYNGNHSRPVWKPWIIDLASLGISLNNITGLTISVEGSGSGVIYLDEIGLYQVAPEVSSEEVWVEAETGTVTAPMMKYNDPNASGGQYVSTVTGTADEGTAPPYPNGTVTIPFSVEGGTYTARFRIGFPGGDDSCWVRIQGATVQPEVTPLADGWLHFNDIPTGDYWHWSQQVKHEGGAEPPVEFTMPAGTYNLEIAYRGADLRIDAIEFSKIDTE
ncbi:MAG: discoidin domain-containing protein [Sedimentisphaerales bacterium]|nr:discoidin domain-containing protein [Sedimentisphaerales bacterium]